MSKSKTPPPAAKKSALLSSPAMPVPRGLMAGDDLFRLGGMVTLLKPHAAAECSTAARIDVTTIAWEEFIPAIRHCQTSTAGLKL